MSENVALELTKALITQNKLANVEQVAEAYYKFALLVDQAEQARKEQAAAAK